MQCFASKTRSDARKWPWIVVLVITLASFGVVSHAQSANKVPLIGYLSALDPASEASILEAIRLALRKVGYIEGQNIAIEYRFAEGKLDRSAEFAAELVRLKVDLIVVSGGSLVIRFATIPKQRPDGVYVPDSGPLIRANGKRLAAFTLKHRLPSVYDNRDAVDAGGLMYYGADQADTYRRIAYYVDKILKGAKPADLPVEQSSKFELAFKLKTAKQIGVTIPQSLL